MIEWLTSAPEADRGTGRSCTASPFQMAGNGALTLSVVVAAHVAGESAMRAGGNDGLSGGLIVFVDRFGCFHPPAVFGWLRGVGDDATRSDAVCGQLVVVRPSRDDDEAWAIDQALRCRGVAAVVASPSERMLRSAVMRRWQLAARHSGAVGLLVRPWQSRREPSWAEARIVVRPVSGGQSPSAAIRCWYVERLTSALHAEGRGCEVTIDLERGLAVATSSQPRSACFRSEAVLPMGVGSAMVRHPAASRPWQGKENTSCRAS